MPDAYRNFTQSVTVIRRRCGDRIASAAVQALYNVAYRQILDNYQWYARLEETVVNTVDEYSTGTVTVVQGSATVTGLATVWTAAMVGRFIRIRGEFDVYRIAAVGGPTSLTLEKEWAYSGGSGESYVVFQYIYSLPDDVAWPLVTTHQGPMEERPKSWIDVRDPMREIALDFPTVWATHGEGDAATTVPRRNFAQSVDFLQTMTHDKVTDAVLGEMYNIAYREIVNNHKWHGRLDETLINTVDPYSTGTVAMTQGSATITGTGTTWTLAMVGRYLRINNSNFYHKISDVLSATVLVIEIEWPSASAADQVYEIFQLIYALPSDAEAPSLP